MDVDTAQPILRQYSPRKDTRAYTDRYAPGDFERYHEITQNIERFEQWQRGINPVTKRKIQIGGLTHQQIGYEYFFIHRRTSSFLFTTLDGYHEDSYMDETKHIKQTIDAYNATVNDAIREIDALQRWDDYVVFDGHHYGIAPVHANIHREKDCMGVVVETGYKRCRCRSCEYWSGCSDPTGTQHYACEECGYTFSTSHSSKNYKGK
jgi:hypothetical protein